MTDELDPNAGRIAVIGMAGRFPGAPDVEALWEVLRAGRETVSFFAPDEIDPSVPAEIASDPAYVPARGVIEGADEFDAEFFRMRPLEAKVMDPQQRIFLETCVHALENAGCDPSTFDGAIGVFASASASSYLANHLEPNPEVCEAAGNVAVHIGNDLDYIAPIVAYRLNLKGPAVSLRTACSSSLVAIVQGCQALVDYQCDVVLAGGVSVNAPQSSGYLHQIGGILSSDGHCRTFDAQAQGTYFSNGAGVVVLKRLDEALRDGDDILAVLRGFAINNDGADRVSFTAPNPRGQAEVVAMAQEIAGVDPETVTYVEAHGTATEVGDPIEIEALTSAFRRGTDARGFCGVGSIKSNFGHLDVAAGVAGLIKTVLALKHRFIPPSINFSAPNAKIDFESSPFYVVSEGRAWDTGGGPRRAGVSSFGTGGTNAHVVLEEAPVPERSPEPPGEELLLLSARTPDALGAAAEQLAARLKREPRLNLGDVAYTLRCGRTAHDHRRFAVCASLEQACEVLRKQPARLTGARRAIAGAVPLVKMFPGQGTQYPGMGGGLYASEPVYRETVDRCLGILEPILGGEMRRILFPEDADTGPIAERLRDTAFAQPAIFLTEYALAKLWQHRGVTPDAMIGHSIGEFVAACLAGVFSLDDALRLVALRGQLMHEQPTGAMLSVRAPAGDIAGRLPAELALACVNGPALCVVSGPAEAIGALRQELEAEQLACRILHTSHAFHSAMMEPVIEPFLAELRKVELNAPRMRIMSTVTADWLTDAQGTDAMYWARHLRETVRFADGIGALVESGARVFLECGARTTLTTLARQQFPKGEPLAAVPSLGEDSAPEAERIACLRAAGELWASGVDVDWQGAGVTTRGRKVALPGYAFERKRHWVDAPPAVRMVPPETGDIADFVGRHKGEARCRQQAPDTPASSAGLSGSSTETEEAAADMTPSVSRADRLIELVMSLLTEISGTDLEDTDPSMTFLEMGFDSLFLTQVSGKLGKQTGVAITFRQMLEDYPSPKELAAHLDTVLPPDAFQPAPAAAPQAAAPAAVSAPAASPLAAGTLDGSPDLVRQLLAEQLEIMRRQLALVGGLGGDTAPVPEAPARAQQPAPPPRPAAADGARPFGPSARVNRSRAEPLTPDQTAFVHDLVARYAKKTAKSKASTQSNRRSLADPRTVSGFHPLWKEIVYPIVATGSSGSRIFDLDGHEYIDVTNGFGTILFGHKPDFIVDAIARQLKAGYETGPQTPLAGKAAALVSELTGHERVTFTNTGSEAVLAAMRMARTCTGKEKIAVFANSYHGIFDEVLVRAAGGHGALPAAPGIPASATGNVLVLDYGAEESLRVIERERDNLAAVLVEAIQGSDPTYQPVEFLRELRQVTERTGIALIFDEVVTGFRVHPAGAQGLFGIRADIATYGKVVGGGMPIGIVAGSAKYMDALDGGYWEFGDDSRPEANMTFFAGTFVRHPLALAAAVAVLERLKQSGPALQQALNERVGRFAQRLNRVFEDARVPMKFAHFASAGRILTTEDLPYAGLLYCLLREKGIHIWEGRALILTTAHSEEDLDRVIDAFAGSIRELQSVALLPSVAAQAATSPAAARPPAPPATNGAPVPGAQLGRTPEGYPAWFIPDPKRPGKYIQVGEPLTVE